jgi:hypothetical protein
MIRKRRESRTISTASTNDLRSNKIISNNNDGATNNLSARIHLNSVTAKRRIDIPMRPYGEQLISTEQT